MSKGTKESFDVSKQKAKVFNVRREGDSLLWSTIFGNFEVRPFSDEVFQDLKKAEKTGKMVEIKY